MPTGDPLATSSGSWGQAYADQWGLGAVGLTPTLRQQLLDKPLQPITVALVDTGIDYRHPELPASQFWRNPNEKIDGQDSDGNGLIDDLIGWNFVAHSNQPWDDHGHGTHLAGVIAARSDNGQGIAGMAPNARIMALKALDGSGYGRGADIAAAIRYAVDQGARVIQLSLGGAVPGVLERDAIAYAVTKQRLVVVAAGNQARAVVGQGYGQLAGVLLVGAVSTENRRARFSDWGPELGVLAPGVDILSLRARGSDFLQRMLVQQTALQAPERASAGVSGSAIAGYRPGSAIVKQHYYRATGNSFAASFVTAAAALLLGQTPQLDAAALKRVLQQSAEDLEPPGPDMNSGYGVLNVAAALQANPQWFIDSQLQGAQWLPEQGLQLYGRADASRFKAARLEWGAGDKPRQWSLLQHYENAVPGGVLALIDPQIFTGQLLVTFRLTVESADNSSAARSRQSYLQIELPATHTPPSSGGAL
ncbi:MAG: S8 family serine peptidase [Marinobacterium sp.]|nr:S8 family serine peptidase [Marinobacterium sp.]